eukprot:gb/GEZN01005754.1/.p1 GENE.gb/GEZN01005754.1/~~gb/GEZN01005754.1/.p1  ORF type:complete len:532 (+),score=64.16 gb/GEZN01005754.1/:39-1634(+)
MYALDDEDFECLQADLSALSVEQPSSAGEILSCIREHQSQLLGIRETSQRNELLERCQQMLFKFKVELPDRLIGEVSTSYSDTGSRRSNSSTSQITLNEMERATTQINTPGLVNEDDKTVVYVDRQGRQHYAGHCELCNGLTHEATSGPPQEDQEKARKRKARDYKEMERELKWAQMCKYDFAEYQRRHRTQVKNRIRKGIPDSFRARVWPHLTGAYSLKMTKPKNFYQNLLENDSEWTAVIKRDIGRTFPSHTMFTAIGFHEEEKPDYEVAVETALRSCLPPQVIEIINYYTWANSFARASSPKAPPGQQALFNVLKAYSNYDRVLGYCQSLNFITGIFLMYFTEEDAFWMLISILATRGLRKMFLDGFPLLKRYFFIIEKLIQEHNPKFVKHLLFVAETNQIAADALSPQVYTTAWFMTLYASMLPLDVTLRLWDIMLSEGTKVLFRMALLLVKQQEANIIAMKDDFSLVMKRLQRMYQCPIMDDPDEVINELSKISLSRRDIKRLENKYKQMQQQQEQKRQGKSGSNR